MADDPPITREEIAALVRSLSPEAVDTDARDVAARATAILIEAAEKRRERAQEESMNLRVGVKPLQFDWSMNVGHLLTVLTLVIGGLGTVFMMGGRFSELEKNQEAANQRAMMWIPRIEEAMRMNNLQDVRIQNLTESLQDLRKSQNEMVVIMGQIREDMATVRAKLAIERPIPSR